MHTDTLRLWVPVPWHSLEYQDVIKTDSMNLYGNAMTGGFYTQHTTGQKQYELTDHLGDVLATVSDKRAGNTFTALPGTSLTAGSPALLDTWKPVVVSAYDYYPFGQYMPGRYFVDTASYCYTATISELVPQIYYTWQPWVLIESSGITVIGHTTWTDGGTPVSGTLHAGRKSDGIQYNITGVPIEVPTQLFLRTGTIKDTFTASITEDSSAKVIGSVQLSDKQGSDFIYPIPFMSTTGRIRVTITSTIAGAASLQFIGQQVPHDTMIPQNVVTTVCNNDWYRYRYGFNGKYKDNEWAGVGNSLDFGARMNDTIIGRFRSVDNMSGKFPSFTPYSFAANRSLVLSTNLASARTSHRREKTGLSSA